MKKSIALSLLAAGPLYFGACSSSSGKSGEETAKATEKQAQAEQKLCVNMNEMESSIRQYPVITTETPLDSIRAANERVDKAVQGVRESAKDVSNPGVVDVQTAYQDLQNTINTVPEGQGTVGEASDSVTASAQKLREAWDKLYLSMECGA
jgi:hypothetical protein